jgi:hypothetical protein
MFIEKNSSTKPILSVTSVTGTKTFTPPLSAWSIRAGRIR